MADRYFPSVSGVTCYTGARGDWDCHLDVRGKPYSERGRYNTVSCYGAWIGSTTRLRKDWLEFDCSPSGPRGKKTYSCKETTFGKEGETALICSLPGKR